MTLTTDNPSANASTQPVTKVILVTNKVKGIQSVYMINANYICRMLCEDTGTFQPKIYIPGIHSPETGDHRLTKYVAYF